MIVHQMADREIKADRELMLQACLIESGRIFRCVDETLRRDRSFIEEVLRMNLAALKNAPPDSQRLFPDLVLQSLKPYFELAQTFGSDTLALNDCLLLKTNLREMFQDRQQVLAWFSAGGPLVWHNEMLKNDKEIFLLIAENCH